MIHPHTELKFISHEKGYGVVATQYIPKGTVTWILDKLDRKFTPIQFSRLDATYQKILDTYTFRDNKGNYILCWDLARYVNHSFHPNCMTTAYNFELAIKNIEPGQEITNDYGTLNVTQPFYCLSENRSKRKTVYPDDLLHYHLQWDRCISNAIQYFYQVKQPLSIFMSTQMIKNIKNIIFYNQPMNSILNCYCGKKRSIKLVV